MVNPEVAILAQTASLSQPRRPGQCDRAGDRLALIRLGKPVAKPAYELDIVVFLWIQRGAPTNLADMNLGQFPSLGLFRVKAPDDAQ